MQRTQELCAKGFKKVGDLIRTEAMNLVVGYEFDLKNNNIAAKTVPNLDAGKQHRFVAYRVESDSDKSVTVISHSPQEDVAD